MEVYLLWHAHDLDAEVDVKLLGVYASQQKAEDARLRVSSEPGFRELPQGFQISRYELDKDHWTEGFETVRWREFGAI
jgi:hypothetical protein